MKRNLTLVAAGAATAALLLSGCSTAAGSGGDASACSNTVVHPDAKLVDVWGWYTSFETVADQFNETHDDLQVCWTNAGQGGDEYTKLKTSLAAGSGAPDVVQIEYDQLYSYTIGGSLVDLSEYGAADLESEFPAGTWNDVSYGGSVWGIPVDGGPMGVYYRKDLLAQAGIETLPTTWEEFAADAQKYQASGVEGTFVNFPLNGQAEIMGLTYQAGSSPFTYDPSDPTTVRVDLDNAEAEAVLDYWFGLARSGAVGHDDAWTADNGAALASGGFASYIGASWSSSYLSGLSGASADAQWTVGPLPQWDASEPTAATWTAGALAVTSQAEDKEAAAEVAQALYRSEDALAAQIESEVFPASVAGQSDPSFVDKPFPFYGDQQLNKDVFVPAVQNYEGVQYSPFSAFLYSTMDAVLPAAFADGQSAADALASIQEQVVDYAEQQGFTVTTGS